MSRAFIFAFFGVVILSACNQQNYDPPGQSSLTQREPQAKTISPVPASDSISSEVAMLFAGLVVAIEMHPDRNAVDAYAKGMNWREIPEEMNAMLNAKRGYAGKLANQVVLIGSDGTNDIFSIAVREGFDPQAFKDGLQGVLSLNSGTADTSMGQEMEMYRLLDGEREIGILSITYGTAEAVRGSGTVGYISTARASAEGIGN